MVYYPSNPFPPMMKIIDLTCFENPFGFGILFPSKSGFTYTNQVGGSCCAHPTLEGIYVPLRPLDPDLNWSADALQDRRMKTYEDSHAEMVTEFLKFTELDDVLTSPSKLDFDLAIPNSYLADAWVPVQVKPIPPYQFGNGAVLHNLVGKIGILTY